MVIISIGYGDTTTMKPVFFLSRHFLWRQNWKGAYLKCVCVCVCVCVCACVRACGWTGKLLSQS